MVDPLIHNEIITCVLYEASRVYHTKEAEKIYLIVLYWSYISANPYSRKHYKEFTMANSWNMEPRYHFIRWHKSIKQSCYSHFHISFYIARYNWN